MTLTEKAFSGLNPEALTNDQLRSRESMKALGDEYTASADKLRERIELLKSRLDTMPLKERKLAEKRIELLQQEIRETLRTGSEAGNYYLPGHRFLPRQSKNAVYPGAYIC